MNFVIIRKKTGQLACKQPVVEPQLEFKSILTICHKIIFFLNNQMMATMSFTRVSIRLPQTKGFSQDGQRRSINSLNIRCNASDSTDQYVMRTHYIPKLYAFFSKRITKRVDHNFFFFFSFSQNHRCNCRSFSRINSAHN